MWGINGLWFEGFFKTHSKSTVEKAFRSAMGNAFNVQRKLSPREQKIDAFDKSLQARLIDIMEVPKLGFTKKMVAERIARCDALRLECQSSPLRVPSKDVQERQRQSFESAKNDLVTTLIYLSQVPVAWKWEEPRLPLQSFDACFYTEEDLLAEKEITKRLIPEIRKKLEKTGVQEEKEDEYSFMLEEYADIFVDAMWKWKNRVTEVRKLNRLWPKDYVKAVIKTIYKEAVLVYVQENIVSRWQEWKEDIRNQLGKFFADAKKWYYMLDKKKQLLERTEGMWDAVVDLYGHTQFGKEVLSLVMKDLRKQLADIEDNHYYFLETYLLLHPKQVKEIAKIHITMSIGELLEKEQNTINDRREADKIREQERQEKRDARKAKHITTTQAPVIKKQPQKKIVPEYVTNFAALVCRGIKQKKAATENSVTRTVLNDYPLDVQAVYAKAGLSLDNSTYKIISQAADLNNIQIKEREEPKKNSLRWKKEGSKKSKKRSKGKKGVTK